jgi:1,4-dihydroxy-2-naphthoate octaprenyltransferase
VTPTLDTGAARAARSAFVAPAAAPPLATRWIAAARPRTLPAAVAPVLVGSACALHAGGFVAVPALAALLVALLLQVATNFVNDWGDHRRGADGPDRVGPSRAVAAGWISPRAMVSAAALAFGVAALLGLYLTLRGGAAALALGMLSIAAGIAYTAGPFPLAYRGLGEPFVFVFFGPVAVCGTELVQRGAVSPLALAASVPVGLLAAAILVVNNVRDVDGDARAGKRTIAVRLGASRTRGLYVLLVAAALASPLLLAWSRMAPGSVLLAGLAFLAAPTPLGIVRHETGAALNAALAQTARLHLVFGALLAAGIALPALVGRGA